MRKSLAVLLFCLGLCSLAGAQTVDLNMADNGACNAPCATMGKYYTNPVVGELIFLEFGWGGQTQTITSVTDGVNTYHALTPVQRVGSTFSTQVWWTINTGAPFEAVATLSAPSVAGWFDGMFVQSIGLLGVDANNPIDTGSIGTGTGTGTAFSATSQTFAASGEQVWAFWTESAAGPPYVAPAGWTEVGGGEAISATSYNTTNITSTTAQTATLRAGNPSSWAGTVFGVVPGTSGTGSGGGGGSTSGILTASCESTLVCYVLASATGNGTGVDWYNAYTSLPNDLQRGATYYVAAGTYPGHYFDDQDSGTLTITIQAATVAAHGASTGWSNSYAGQAVFNQADATGVGDILTFGTDYYILNGVTRSSATGNPVTDWQLESGYGFKIDNSGKVACNADIDIADNAAALPIPVHDILIEYVDVNGSHETVPDGCREAGIQAVWGSYNYTLLNSYVHNNGGTNLQLRGDHANCDGTSSNVLCGPPQSGYGLGGTYGDGSNILVANNYFYRSYSDPTRHAEGCSCSEGLQNFTIANNYWQDISGTAVIATPSGGDWNTGNGGNGPWYIYGNVAFETSCAAFTGETAGVAAFFYKWDTTFIAPIYIFNNTIYNFPAACNSGSGILLDDGNYPSPAFAVYVENNLWVNADGTQIANTCDMSAAYASCTSMTWSNNAYFASADNSGNADSDSHAQISSSMPLVNPSAGDFGLLSNTFAGTNTNSLFAPNSADLLGTLRGDNGVWDRGALQIFQLSPTVVLTNAAALMANGVVVW